MKMKMMTRRKTSRGRTVVESSFICWLYILYLLYACLHSKFLAKYQSAEWKLSKKTAQSQCLSFSLSMSPLFQTYMKDRQCQDSTYPSQGRYLLLLLFTTPSNQVGDPGDPKQLHNSNWSLMNMSTQACETQHGSIWCIRVLIYYSNTHGLTLDMSDISIYI